MQQIIASFCLHYKDDTLGISQTPLLIIFYFANKYVNQTLSLQFTNNSLMLITKIPFIRCSDDLTIRAISQLS